MMAVQAFRAWALCWLWHSFQRSAAGGDVCAATWPAAPSPSIAMMDTLRICIGWPSFTVWRPKLQRSLVYLIRSEIAVDAEPTSAVRSAAGLPPHELGQPALVGGVDAFLEVCRLAQAGLL